MRTSLEERKDTWLLGVPFSPRERLIAAAQLRREPVSMSEWSLAF
jgi:hypothetical protein